MLRACKEHHPTAGAYGIHCKLDKRVAANSYQRNVGPAALRRRLCCSNYIATCVERMIEVELRCYGDI
jgi:hypothetical protein